MVLTGGCFCGAVRFELTGPMRMRGLCLCHSCQRVSGGAGNLFAGLAEGDFHYTKGEPKLFRHPDRPEGPTREFCADCGTHLAARSPRAPGGVIVKVGALDDPGAFEGPQFVVWTEDKQDFHVWPAGVKAFERTPGR